VHEALDEETVRRWEKNKKNKKKKKKKKR